MDSKRQDLVARAAELDERRQRQIKNQVASIERLLSTSGVTDPGVAAAEIARLHEQIAKLEQELRNLA